MNRKRKQPVESASKQIQDRENQEKLEEERKAREKQQYLQKRSSPLVQLGLVDAFEYFMVRLTQAGIPHPNVYEFAAQAVLKYEKQKAKKDKELKEINKFNSKAVNSQATRKVMKSPPRKKNRPQNMLPFKARLSAQEMAILEQLEKQ